MIGQVRLAQPEDYQPLADLWLEGWIEAHKAHVPPALTALRTRPDFLRRLRLFGDDLRVAGPIGAPLGFCAILGDHLDQLFVARAGRGTGLASALLRDGERRLAENGVSLALLDCVIANAPARRFYARQGWIARGIETAVLETSQGPFEMECVIFQKFVA